ncbi:hypothetical protein CHS0354_010979 [Potamilus streckersoni]|nr:hypothetical protein CHS0354_010979 [Potamilus streckersoni]
METHKTLKLSDVKNGSDLMYVAETQMKSTENHDRKEVDIRPDLCFAVQETPEKKDDRDQKLTDDQKLGKKTIKTFTDSENSVPDKGFKSEEVTMQKIHPEKDDSKSYSGEEHPMTVKRNDPIWMTEDSDVGIEEIEASDFRDMTKKPFACRNLDNEEFDEAKELKIGITYVHNNTCDRTFFENLPNGKTFLVESDSADCICVRQKRRVVEILNKTFKLISLRGTAALTDRAAYDPIYSIFIQCIQLIGSEHMGLWIENIKVLLEVTSVAEGKRCYICVHQAFFLIVQSERGVVLWLHTMRAFILVLLSPSLNMITIVYCQLLSTMTHIMRTFNISTFIIKSCDLIVLPFWDSVKREDSTADLKRKRHPDIKRKFGEDQNESSSDLKLDHFTSKKMNSHRSRIWNDDMNKMNSQMTGRKGHYGFILELDDIISFMKPYELHDFLWHLCSFVQNKSFVYVSELVPRHFIRQNRNYDSENSRITTFPVNFENRVGLAHAGFVYDFERDIVVCPWCDVLVDTHNLAEDPVNWHSPTCEFRVINHEIHIPVIGAISSPPTTVENHGAGQVNDQNVPSASQITDGQVIISNSSSIISQEPHTGMRVVPNAAIPAAVLNVLPALSQPDSRQSFHRDESNLTSDRSSYNLPSSDIRTRYEEAYGLQNEMGTYVSSLYLPPVTPYTAGEQPFQRAVPISAQEEQPHADKLNLHKGGGDARSLELLAIESLSETLRNALGGNDDTVEGSSGRGEIETRVDETSIQESCLADTIFVKEPPPKYPEFAERSRRLYSFKEWPAKLPQKPEEMAECGFYYTGQEDIVQCFYCGGGLKQWQSDDDPWIEHIRWYPNCSYVHKKKGREFVISQQAAKIANIIAARTEGSEENESSENNVLESADDQNEETEEGTTEHEAVTYTEVIREHQELCDATF